MDINTIIKIYESAGIDIYKSLLIDEDTIDNIYEKYYSNIPKETFIKIISIDPTTNVDAQKMGKYSKWLLNLFNNNKLQLNDTDHIFDLINKFIEIKRINTGNNAIPFNTDINHYKNIDELASAISDFEAQNHSHMSNIAINKLTKMNGSIKIYSDDTWEALRLLTKEAAILYGKGTKWCTSAKSDRYNAFDRYISRGYKLYVNINKVTKEKYQFCFECNEYMDASDNRVDIFKIGLPIKLLVKYSEKYGSSRKIGDLTIHELNNKCICKNLIFNFIKLNQPQYGFIAINGPKGFNYLDSNGDLLSQEWFYEVSSFINNDIGIVCKDDEHYNFINNKGEILFPNWPFSWIIAVDGQITVAFGDTPELYTIKGSGLLYKQHNNIDDDKPSIDLTNDLTKGKNYFRVESNNENKHRVFYISKKQLPIINGINKKQI